MAQFFSIHPDNPQTRLIQQAADIIANGGVVVYPTDSCYALGCHLGSKTALDRIRMIRQFDKHHNFTLVCADFSSISQYAEVDNQHFRLLKNLTPGPYTFILPATREVPKRLMHPKRKTVGIRIPDNNITRGLVGANLEPLMSVSLLFPGEEFPETDAYTIRERLENQVDLVIDGGFCGMEPTSVVDLSGDVPAVIRAGKGDVSLFE